MNKPDAVAYLVAFVAGSYVILDIIDMIPPQMNNTGLTLIFIVGVMAWGFIWKGRHR